MSETSTLTAMLRGHYIKPGVVPPGYVFLEECGLNGVGGSRVDALAIGFTSASGRKLIGHEVKVSRADWRRELDKPGKADTWADQCHEWWVVAPSTTIVPPAELPDGWGLLIPPRSGRRMTTVVPATTHHDRTPSWLIMRSILARLDTLHHQQIRDLQYAAQQEAQTAARDIAQQQAQQEGRMTREQRDRLALLDQVEDTLGAPLTDFAWRDNEKVDPERLAGALKVDRALSKFLTRGNPEFALKATEQAAEGVLAGVTELREALTMIRDMTDRSAS